MTRDWQRSRGTLVLLLLVAQIIFAGFLGGARIRLSHSRPVPAPISSFDFDTPPNALTLITGHDRAEQVAAGWDPDARLVYASMQIDWPGERPPDTVTSVSPFGWVRYVYYGESADGEAGAATLSLLFERVSGRLIRQTVNRWTEPFAPGDRFAGISTTDLTAVLGAEIGGATAFRAACPNLRNRTVVSLVLDPETAQPVWIIGYPGKNGDMTTGMAFQVNASTGQMTLTRQPPAACPEQ